jgi:hypothetical protein
MRSGHDGAEILEGLQYVRQPRDSITLALRLTLLQLQAMDNTLGGVSSHILEKEIPSSSWIGTLEIHARQQ